MTFNPMVTEASGERWGFEATKTWSELAKIYALALGELQATVPSRLLCSLAVILHQENARTVLRWSPQATVTGAAAQRLFSPPNKSAD